MNILFLDQFSALGGGQQCLRDLIPAIVAQKWVAHVGLPPGGPLAQQIADRGAIVHEIALEHYSNGRKSANDVMRFAGEAPRLAVKIRDLIKRNRIDLVYVNGPRLLPSAALAADKLVFHSHSLLNARYTVLLATASLRIRHATTIAASRFVAQPLQSHLPSERLRVIYNGVPDYGAVKRSIRTPRQPVIGMIGRIAPEKGQLDFVRAAQLLHKDVPSSRFLVCGDSQHSDGDYFSQVRELAKDLPIDFLPWQEDVGPVLRKLDAIVLPSLGVDATPRVILEAFSARVPVVAYRSGGLGELIEHETNGMFSSEQTPEALATVLKTLLATPEEMQRLTHNARRCYLSRFTLDRYRHDVIEVLDRI